MALVALSVCLRPKAEELLTRESGLAVVPQTSWAEKDLYTFLGQD